MALYLAYTPGKAPSVYTKHTVSIGLKEFPFGTCQSGIHVITFFFLFTMEPVGDIYHCMAYNLGYVAAFRQKVYV